LFLGKEIDTLENELKKVDLVLGKSMKQLLFLSLTILSCNNAFSSAEAEDEITVIFNYGQPNKSIYALLQTSNPLESLYLFKQFEDGRAESETLEIAAKQEIIGTLYRICKPEKADLASLNPYRAYVRTTLKNAIGIAKEQAQPDAHSSWTLSSLNQFATAKATQFTKN